MDKTESRIKTQRVEQNYVWKWDCKQNNWNRGVEKNTVDDDIAAVDDGDADADGENGKKGSTGEEELYIFGWIRAQCIMHASNIK